MNKKLYIIVILIICMTASSFAIQGPAWVQRFLQNTQQTIPSENSIVVHINETCNQTMNLSQKESAKIFMSQNDVKKFTLEQKEHTIKIWSISKNRILYSLDGKIYRTTLPFSQQIRVTYKEMTATIKRTQNEKIFIEFYAFNPSACE